MAAPLRMLSNAVPTEVPGGGVAAEVARGLGLEGFTVMVKGVALPVIPLAVGVTMKVAVTGTLVVLTAVKLAMAPPRPDKPIPMLLLSLVQAKVVPVTVPVKTSVAVFP